jgi:vacuolar-type H+-ATPase subunit H
VNAAKAAAANDIDRTAVQVKVIGVIILKEKRMIHEPIKILALTPATSQPSLQTQQLHAIIQQVEHFYGAGWHSLQASNALMGVVITTVLLVIAGILGVVIPIWLNSKAEERMEKQIQGAREFAKQEVVAATGRMEARITEAIREMEKRTKELMDAVLEKSRNSTAVMVFMAIAVQKDEMIRRLSKDTPEYSEAVADAAYSYLMVLLYLSMADDSDRGTMQSVADAKTRFLDRITLLNKGRRTALLQRIQKSRESTDKDGKLTAGNATIIAAWKEALEELRKLAQ